MRKVSLLAVEISWQQFFAAACIVSTQDDSYSYGDFSVKENRVYGQYGNHYFAAQPGDGCVLLSGMWGCYGETHAFACSVASGVLEGIATAAQSNELMEVVKKIRRSEAVYTEKESELRKRLKGALSIQKKHAA